MEITCKTCGSKFRAALQLPLTAAVRVVCPACSKQMVLKPSPPEPKAPERRTAVIADEPRPFREFLADQLRKAGFDVQLFETGDPCLEFVRNHRSELAILNVYLRGKLGVEISEAIKADPRLGETRVILIGALFRANRFRANPTNLYGADEYIEEQIPEREFRRVLQKLFPQIDTSEAPPAEAVEVDDARRLARLILSDILISNGEQAEKAIRDDTFFTSLRTEIEEGRKYYESRVPFRLRQDTEIYNETLQQFVRMKREELERRKSEGLMSR